MQNVSQKSLGDKNKKVKGGTKFTFSFQGKISVLNPLNSKQLISEL